MKYLKKSEFLIRLKNMGRNKKFLYGMHGKINMSERKTKAEFMRESRGSGDKYGLHLGTR
jgi:hypothetical protein